MTDEELKAICKAGNLHPSNKVMDIVRKIVRATKEEDARICDDVGMFHEFCAGSGLAFELADKIRASK